MLDRLRDIGVQLQFADRFVDPGFVDPGLWIRGWWIRGAPVV